MRLPLSRLWATATDTGHRLTSPNAPHQHHNNDYDSRQDEQLRNSIRINHRRPLSLPSSSEEEQTAEDRAGSTTTRCASSRMSWLSVRRCFDPALTSHRGRIEFWRAPRTRRDAHVPHRLRSDDGLGQLLRLSSISHRSFVFSVIRLSINSADGLFNCPSLSATARNCAAAPGVGLLREVSIPSRSPGPHGCPVKLQRAEAFQPD